MRGAAAFRTGMVIAVITLILDQAHKWWMIKVYGIELGQRVTVTSFMDVVYVINQGVSYGMLTLDNQTGQYILSAFAVFVAIILGTWLWRSSHNRVAVVGIGLIIGGAVGNAVDRLHLGGVADFIQLHAGGYYWYVFNIADVAIVVGVLLLLYDTLVPSRGRAAKES